MMTSDLQALRSNETCRLIQDEERDEPLILLRQGEGFPVHALTVQEAHAILERAIRPHPVWTALDELLQGIR